MSSLWPIYYRIYEKFIRNDAIFYQIFKDHGLLGGVSSLLSIFLSTLKRNVPSVNKFQKR